MRPGHPRIYFVIQRELHMGSSDHTTHTGSPTVAVVGGGAVGVTAAADLAERGAAVTLYERGSLGAGSSGRAAGVVYDAYAADVDALIAARAMERFRSFDRSLPGFSFTQCPYVIAVREGDPDANAIPAMVERMRTHGRDVAVVDADALADRFPIRTADIAAAALAEGAGWCDPARYVTAMAERARREGVHIETETAVAFDGTAAPTLRIGDCIRSFDAVVVAAGAHTEQLLETGTVRVPVTPYRVQALTSRVTYDGPMMYDATAGVYFRPHPTGLLAGDGTEPVAADPDEYDHEADDWFVEDTAETLRVRADHELDLERAWAGLCTATPDGDPLVGPVGDDTRGVFVAAGWQGHGFMRAPAFGEHIADGVLASLSNASDAASTTAAGTSTPRADPWITDFDPARFDGDEPVPIVEGMALDRRTER